MKPRRLSILPVLSLLATLACVSGLAGCRQVTVVSFRTDDPSVQPTQVDQLVVKLDDKSPIPLYHLSDTIGLYDVAGPTIDITVWACFEKQIQLTNPIQTNPIMDGKVVVTLSRYAGDQTTPCPRIVDGGVIGEPSGDSGMTGIGGAGGEAGMTGAGGMGGQMTVGAGGNTDAGAGGAGGDDAGDGTGGCPGTGGAIDAGTCDMPSGTPDPSDVPVVTTLNPACDTYCSDMASACDGTYTSVTQCQRYCTLAGWATGGGSFDKGDTIGCRDGYAVQAGMMTPDQRAAKCANAGPSSIGNGALNCGASVGQCEVFCSAFAGVCASAKQPCLDACATLPAASVSCRFTWLQAASDDRRYCSLIDLTHAATSCRPPGC